MAGWRNRPFLGTMANGTRAVKQKFPEKEAYHGFNANAHDHEFAHRCAPRVGKFPANEDFGKTAWTYYKYGDALRKYDELESRVPISKKALKIAGKKIKVAKESTS